MNMATPSKFVAWLYFFGASVQIPLLVFSGDDRQQIISGGIFFGLLILSRIEFAEVRRENLRQIDQALTVRGRRP